MIQHFSLVSQITVLWLVSTGQVKHLRFTDIIDRVQREGAMSTPFIRGFQLDSSRDR